MPVAIDNDRELVRHCLAGNQDAWVLLYNRTCGTIYYITHWKTWGFSNQEAEEVMQEVLASLVVSLKTFKFDCSLETFASNIAKNKCISHIRKQSAGKRSGEKNVVSLHDESQAAELALEDKRSSFSSLLENIETIKMVRVSLNAISERCRMLIRLRYYQDQSYEEIAKALQLPMGTVASRLKRCLLKLRTLCEQQKGATP